MMLLPSGRSTGDTNPQQCDIKSNLAAATAVSVAPTLTPAPVIQQKLLTRTSAPQLIETINPTNGTEDAYMLLSTKSPGSYSETGTSATKGESMYISNVNDSNNVCGGNNFYTKSVLGNIGNWEELDRHLEIIQHKLKDGWSVHFGKDGRLYYCNQITQTSGWLPSYEDWCKWEELPYGWERGIDSKGRSYYINHLNKTSTYEAPECIKFEKAPEPRAVQLQRSPTLGFGFVAGSERPVIVRFVTDGGPSINKLQPGDQILAVNGEDVKNAPRDHVIQLVRACEAEVNLLVCQPAHNLVPGRKSTLLSAGKRAKLRSRPSRVRFAESVCVNGAPLFPASAFSLGDICVPPMANVLKVFLENGQTKSFKYDSTTTVRDVVISLLDKLCLITGEIFSLVLEHVKSLKRNKLTLLDPDESLARIAARPGAHKLRCLFRVSFVPISAADLAQKDLNALDYLYMQCCNDVTQERFAPELQPEVALRLAALHMQQHALANNISANKLTVKVIEREFGVERFVPASLCEGMKRKELRRLISHFLKLNAEMTGSTTKTLTQLQAKLHYLDIISNLPSYGAKCFSTNQREGVERVLLVSPRFGLSQIPNVRNSAPQPISLIENISRVVVNREDDVTCSVSVLLQNDRVVKFLMEDRDACEFSLVLSGYYLLLTGKDLAVDREREQFDEDNAPSYLAQHTVLPAAWSYLLSFHNRAHSINFLIAPPFHPMEMKPQIHLLNELVANQRNENFDSNTQCDRNMNSANVVNSNYTQQNMASIITNDTTMDLDIHSLVATELLEEAKDSGLSDSSGGGGGGCVANSNIGGYGSNNYYESHGHLLNKNSLDEAKNEEVIRRVHEMQMMVENSQQYLNEQNEYLQECNVQNNRIILNKNFITNPWITEPTDTHAFNNYVADGVIEFDSDCDSLNSSKISSNEETPQSGELKHSDSLTLLAETINQDLSGIAKSLNSIEDNQRPIGAQISSPRPDRKLSGLTQLLNNLQILGTDISQSESDSESINSPPTSPAMRRPSLLFQEERMKRKQNVGNRSSFGLHSPDGNNFGAETKDYNLKEYLKQLKEISNPTTNSHNANDTDLAAKKLSEIYGFEIREDTFIETDTDLIDLRAIPPPQTPDELDALSILNAAPRGFDDTINKKPTTFNQSDDADFEKFLENVVVAPPTQKMTPSKELTPEEIMSFIIPPPPNLDKIETNNRGKVSISMFNADESLYSNSKSANMPINTMDNGIDVKNSNIHIIEYATVERKSKFSCCPKGKKESKTNDINKTERDPSPPKPNLKLPPRGYTMDIAPPARPPKSAELLERLSPKKQLTKDRSPAVQYPSVVRTPLEVTPPIVPPRINLMNRLEEPINAARATDAPEKPPLPPIPSRPAHLVATSQNIPQIYQKPMHSNSNGNSNIQITPKPKINSNIHSPPIEKRTQLTLLNSPQLPRKLTNMQQKGTGMGTVTRNKPMIIKNGHIIDGEALLAKTDIAMAGLLIKLDQIADQCSAAYTAGGGRSIDEDKFQRARNELTEETLVLVTASKFLVVAMSDATLSTLPEHLTSCLSALRRITELTQDIAKYTSAPLQTRNIVLKVHDVASSFRELVGVEVGPQGAGQLALQAECLANVLATLLRSLRIFSP